MWGTGTKKSAAPRTSRSHPSTACLTSSGTVEPWLLGGLSPGMHRAPGFSSPCFLPVHVRASDHLTNLPDSQLSHLHPQLSLCHTFLLRSPCWAGRSRPAGPMRLREIRIWEPCFSVLDPLHTRTTCPSSLTPIPPSTAWALDPFFPGHSRYKGLEND